jgi:hypothetical protein
MSTITLTTENSLDFLIQYTELAQKNGVFNLQEADLLKKAVDALKDVPSEISKTDAQNLLTQAVAKGQSKGCYSLADASTIYNICLFLSKQLSQSQGQVQSQSQGQEPEKLQSIQEEEPEELFDLSAPVPIRQKQMYLHSERVDNV